MTPALTAGCVIAILGAESTGKTDLARALAERLAQRGVAVTRVGEYLREWCEREGRTPRPEEQAAIGAEQTRRIADAAMRGVVIADTTALMTAVYSDLLFNDRTLYADALRAQGGYVLTLLTALDLPWVADGLQRDGPHVQAPVDAMVRAALARGGLTFAVVHGQGAQRLKNAWQAIDRQVQSKDSPDLAQSARAQAAWRWSCEKCSDPVCEHKLFSDLVAQRR